MCAGEVLGQGQGQWEVRVGVGVLILNEPQLKGAWPLFGRHNRMPCPTFENVENELNQSSKVKQQKARRVRLARSHFVGLPFTGQRGRRVLPIATSAVPSTATAAAAAVLKVFSAN